MNNNCSSGTVAVVGSRSLTEETAVGLYRQLSISPDGQTPEELTRLQSPPVLPSSAYRAAALRSLNFQSKTRMVMSCAAAGQLVALNVEMSVMGSNTLI